MGIKRLGADARGRVEWRVDWYAHGRRHYQRMVGDRAVAERFLADRRAERLNAAAGIVAPAAQLRVAVKEYLATAERHNREGYVSNLRRTLRGLTGPTVAAVNYDWLIQYQRRRSREVSARTVNRELAEIRAFLEWEVNAGRLAENPASRVRPLRVDQKPTRWFTPAEYGALWKAAKPNMRDLMDVYLCTGLRWRELARADFTGHGLVITGRKGRDVLHQRLSEPVQAVFRAHQDARGSGVSWPWLGRVSHRLAKLCASAGHPRAGVHALRHTCATWALACGVDPYRLRQHLGHKSVTQTEAYEGAAEGFNWREEARALPARTRRCWRGTLGIMGVSISYPTLADKSVSVQPPRADCNSPPQRRTG